MATKPIQPFIESVRFEQTDLLKITRLSLAATSGAILRVTMLHDDGQVRDQVEVLNPLLANTTAKQLFTLGAGWLLRATVGETNTTPLGEQYVILERIQNTIETINNTLPILAGYMASESGISFPGHGITSPEIRDPAVIKTGIPVPGAGNNLTLDQFDDTYTQVVGLTARFTASAAVANRTVNFNYNTVGDPLASVAGRTVITAGQSRLLIFWANPNMPADNAAAHYFPIPNNEVIPLLTIETDVTNIQAADDITDIVIWTKTHIDADLI